MSDNPNLPCAIYPSSPPLLLSLSTVELLSDDYCDELAISFLPTSCSPVIFCCFIIFNKFRNDGK